MENDIINISNHVLKFSQKQFLTLILFLNFKLPEKYDLIFFHQKFIIF